MSLGPRRTSERITATLVSDNYFAVLLRERASILPAGRIAPGERRWSC